MPAPQKATVTGTSNSNIVVFDAYACPFNVSVSTVCTGSVNYTVFHTFDNVNPTDGTVYSSASGNWYPHDNTDLVNATSNQNDNYAYAVTAARIVNTGSGSVIGTFIQTGIGRF